MRNVFGAKTYVALILVAMLVFASVVSMPDAFAANGNGNGNNGNSSNGNSNSNGSTNGGGNGNGNSNGNGNGNGNGKCNGNGNKNCDGGTGGSPAPTIVNVDLHTETGVVTFTTSSGSFSSYSNIDEESIPQEWGRPSADLFYGLFSFTITSLPVGSTVTVTISFPSDIPAGSQYWKILNGQWILLPEQFVGSNDGDNILSLTLTDGGIGDADGLPNGSIVDPGGPGTQTSNTSGGCRTVTITNDPTAYARCVVIDTVPPKIAKTFMTPTGYLCVRTTDNTQTVKVSYNGIEIQQWSGSNDHFCTNEELPAIVKIVAEDIAGNESEMVAINPQNVVQVEAEQTFSAVVSKELNPHHGIEGITLDTTEPLKQIRIVKSPEFTDREFHISDKALNEIDGKQTIEVTYKGQYGKERHGYVYVFAANKGLLATFDVVVNDDVRLYAHEQKKSHAAYDLDMRSTSSLDVMNLNAFQKAELESIFAGEYTMTQDRILGMVMTLLDGAN
ncbi:MAG: choice-of-anchor U domain-containing protein [Nitrososphaerales archaeon]